ncbi:MAG TPA: hypothetical protein VJ983_10180 [candidate division Zixibacteria bacterium]|nr:hypothetical protein [candidate division Zixibacteria bacterium]
MKVETIGCQPTAPQTVENSKEKEATKQQETRQDIVEISDGGRRQLAERADARLKESASLSLDTATYKLEQIKQKVDAGYYDIPEVQQRIIRRLSDMVMLQIGSIEPDQKDQ